jgi:hypothetical protein
MLSKPEAPGISGISLRGVWLLRARQPVYRRHDFGSGFVMEHENLSFDVKGKRQVANTTSANTDAIGRGGVACSSEEALVMGVERRSHGVLEMESINLRKEGRNR